MTETNEEYRKAKKIKVKTYQDLFLTLDGKFVLEDLEKAYNSRGSFVSDPYTTAYNEGQRSVYLALKALVDFDLGKI